MQIARSWRRCWRKRRFVSIGLALSILFCQSGTVQALPQGGTISAGNAVLAKNGNTLQINQGTDRLIIDWLSFSIAAGERVNFWQPNAQSVALNRIIGNDPSAIFGALNANGRVFLINPNGILFGKNAQVNVGALTAATLSIDNADFMNGKYCFERRGTVGGILNEGSITAAKGGAIALIAPKIANNGLLVAEEGRISLLAGEKVTLGDSLLAVAVDKSIVETAIQNGGLIRADGGQVVLNAQTAQTLTSSIVNTGEIGAKSLTNRNGVISIIGSGNVAVSGKISASGTSGGSIEIGGAAVKISAAEIRADGEQSAGTIRIGGDYQGGGSMLRATSLEVANDVAISADAQKNGNGGRVILWSDDATSFAGTISARGATGRSGGFVEVSGKRKLNYRGRVDTRAAGGKTGELLLDPNDFNIGSDTVDGKPSDLSGAALAAQLGFSNVTILSGQGTQSGTNSGNINVNEAVTWSSSNSLTLRAVNDVNVRANITATGSGANITLRADSGATGHGTVNFSTAAMASVKNAVDGGEIKVQYNPGSYAAPTDYSAHLSAYSGKAKAYMLINDVNALQAMQGNLTGSYVLGRDIDATQTRLWNGGKGWLPIGTPVHAFSGSLDGDGRTVNGLFVQDVTAANIGLIGVAQGAKITDLSLRNLSFSGGDNANVGGLIGSGTNTTLLGCTVSGQLNAGTGASVGGLIGAVDYSGGATITSSANQTAVSGGTQSFVGGLIGISKGYSSVSHSRSEGAITGGDSSYAGGLIGCDYGGSAISSTYNNGDVTVRNGNMGGPYVGGLIGKSVSSTISNSYNRGNILGGVDSGFSFTGGLIGVGVDCTVNHSYNVGTVSGGMLVGGLIGCDFSSVAINGSYNAGTVSGTYAVGGLLGAANNSAIDESYNVGKVNGAAGSNSGGLVGLMSPTGTLQVTNSYWNRDTTGQLTTAGNLGGGKTDSQMKQAATFAGWGFGESSPWLINQASSYPILTWNAVKVSGSGAGGSATINQYLAGFQSAVVGAADKNIQQYAADGGGNYSFYLQKGWHSLLTSTGTNGGMVIGEDNAGALSALNDNFSANMLKTNYNVSVADLKKAYVAGQSQPYAISGQDVVLNSGTGLQTAENGCFTADGNLLTQNAGQSYGGAVRMTGDYTLRSADSGNIEFKGAVELERGMTVESAGDLRISAPLRSATTDSSSRITLAAARNFINANPSGSGILPGAGRYLIYAADPRTSTIGMTNYAKRYDQGYAGGITPAYAGAGNWVFYSYAPTISVGHAAQNSVYGTVGTSGNFAPTYSGFIDGDTALSAGVSGTATYAVGGTVSGAGYATVGNHDLTYNGGLTNLLGYRFVNDGTSTTNDKLTVTPQDLQLSGLTAANKTYDGSSAVQLGGTATVNVLAGDRVTVADVASGQLDNKHAGNGKTVATNATLTGADAGNYRILQQTGLTADVAKKELTTLTLTVANKPYDGTVAAAVDNASAALTAAGVLHGDQVTIAPTAAFVDSQVGRNKPVQIASGASLGGSAAGDYTLNPAAYNVATTADITALPTPNPLPSSVAQRETEDPARERERSKAYGVSNKTLDEATTAKRVVEIAPHPLHIADVRIITMEYKVPAAGFAVNVRQADEQAETATATLADGSSDLPEWLHFDPQTMMLHGEAAPKNALPLRVIVHLKQSKIYVLLMRQNG